MKPVDVPVFQKGCCRSIALVLIDQTDLQNFVWLWHLSLLRYELLLWRPGADAFGARGRPFCRLRFGLRPKRDLIESESSERKSSRQNDLNLFGRVNKIPKKVLVRIRACRVGGGVIALVDHIR